jgi:hypothetical protein
MSALLLFSKKKSFLSIPDATQVRNKYELESGVIFNELVMESGEAIQVSFKLWRGVEVKKCGVHLVVDEPNVM